MTLHLKLALAACLFVGIASQNQQPRTISSYDRGASITMLKQVKADLKENYYDSAFRGMDLDSTFTEAEQRLRKSGSISESIAVITDVLMRLDDSHTLFLPPDRRARVIYGWQPSMIGDSPYVTGVLSGSDAQRKGLAPGDRLIAWNRFEPTRQNLWQIVYLYNFVRPQALQRLVVRKPDGSEKTFDVESKLDERSPKTLDDLVEELVDAMGVTDDREQLAGDTLVWRYTAFRDPKAAEGALKKARAAKSLVIDLRGNGGGAVEALRTVVSWLFPNDVAIATEKTRKGEKPLTAKGRKDAFTGPVTVLVDSRSGSAAEMLARVIQLEKRGAVLGDRTAGAVMTARLFPHAFGIGSVSFYATSITIGDVRMSDGGSLEKVGVTPDETVLPTGADLAAGRDPVLARAIALLGGTMTAEQAGTFYRR